MSGRMKYVPTDLPSDVRWGFTREGLYAIPHHGHPIAHGRGFAQRMMATYWPELTWQQAFGALMRAGVLIKRGNSFLGYDVVDDVKELHLLIDGSHRVIMFAEGEDVPARPNWAGASLLVSVTSADVSTEGRRRNLTRRILDRLSPNRDELRKESDS